MGDVSTSEPRPGAVTQACLIAGTGSVLTLLVIFSMLSDWGGLEVREQVEEALANSPVRGIAVDDLLGIVKTVLMAIAAFAVAALVLAVFTARRDRAARIGLTVLAAGCIPVALVFGVTGILLSALAAVTLALLWRPESRRWFATSGSARDQLSQPTQEGVTMSEQTPPTGHGGYPAFGADQPSGAQQTPSYGQPPSSGQSSPSHAPHDQPQHDQPPDDRTPYNQPQYAQQSFGPPAYYGYGQPPPPHVLAPDRRPGGVTAAGVVTLVFSALATLICGVVSVAFLVARKSFEEGVVSAAGSMSVSEASFVSSLLGWYFVACTVLSIVALVLAIQLLRDRHRVRVPLVVLSVLTVLLGIITFPLGLFWSAAAIAVIILLFAGSAGAWFDLRNHRTDQQRASY